MTIVTETLAEIVLDGKIRLLGANDAARSSFTAQAGDSLIGLTPGLDVLGRWPSTRSTVDITPPARTEGSR